jgi:hypothetical protein
MSGREWGCDWQRQLSVRWSRFKTGRSGKRNIFRKRAAGHERKQEVVQVRERLSFAVPLLRLLFRAARGVQRTGPPGMGASGTAIRRLYASASRGFLTAQRGRDEHLRGQVPENHHQAQRCQVPANSRHW